MTTIPEAIVTVELEDVSVDVLCFEHAFASLRRRAEAGRLRGFVEATLAINPGLCDAGAILPRGTRVHLPAMVLVDQAMPVVRLWD